MKTNRSRTVGDDGFTLPELLIVVVMVAIIVPVIGIAITTTLRNTDPVNDRSASAVAVQGLTTWFPPDVDSAEPGQFDVSPSRTSGCAGTDPGDNMLWLGWSETFRGVTTNYVANYRFVIDGEVGRIVRVSCSGVFALGTGDVMQMTAALKPDPPTVAPDDFDGDGVIDKVLVTVFTLTGEEIQIEAATKNPNETLPPNSTVVVSTTGPTTTTTTSTTTTTTTTTLAPDPTAPSTTSTTSTTTTSTTTTTTVPPCVVGTITVASSPVALQNKNSGKLKDNVVVTISNLSGYCTGLTLQYVTGAPNGQYVQNFGSTAPFKVTLVGHPSGTELWTPGTKTLEVRDGANNLLTTATLVVTN